MCWLHKMMGFIMKFHVYIICFGVICPPTTVFRGRPFLFSTVPFLFSIVHLCVYTDALSSSRVLMKENRQGPHLSELFYFMLWFSAHPFAWEWQGLFLLGSMILRVCTACFVHLSVEGRLGRFYVLVLGNNPAISMSVQVSRCWVLSLGSMPRSGMSESHVNSVCGLIWRLAIHYDFHVNSAPAFLTSISYWFWLGCCGIFRY